MYQQYSEEERQSLLKYSSSLQSLTKLGLEIYKEQKKLGISNKELASLALFHQILEVGDAIGELIGLGCINASKPILRTLLESYSQLKFLFSNSEERKALQMLYHNEVSKKRYFETLAYPEKGGSFQDRLKNDRLLKGEDIFGETKSDFKKSIQEIEKTISEDVYTEIRREYDTTEALKTKTNGKKYKVKYWYELFNGPKNFQGLSNENEEASLYESIYRYCSSYSHSEDIIYPKIKENVDKTISLIELRSIKELIGVYNYTRMLLEMSLVLILKHKIKNPREFAIILLDLRKKQDEEVKNGDKKN